MIKPVSQPVSFSGQFTDRISRAVDVLRGKPNTDCVVGLNAAAVSRNSLPDLFIRRSSLKENKPCLGQEIIQTILGLKAELAKSLHAKSPAELPGKGIIRIGVVLPNQGSRSEKDVALDVLVDESKYIWVKGKVPHTFNGYDVYLHKASPDNPPIT